MIKTFKNSALKKLYNGDPSKVNSDHRERAEDIMGYLDNAEKPSDMNLAGWDLHQLKGKLKGYWSVSVSGNYRIWFRFENKNAVEVDYGDYH